VGSRSETGGRDDGQTAPRILHGQLRELGRVPHGHATRVLDAAPELSDTRPMTLQIGDIAPDFSLVPSPGADPVSLSALRQEGPVVVLFFPLAFSGVCTDELCAMRDDWSGWSELGASVVGISIDSPFVTKRFAEELDVPFPLLSDFNKEAAEAYDVLYEEFFGMRGVAKRSAFVVGRDGAVRYAWVSEDAGVMPDFDAIRSALAAL